MAAMRTSNAGSVAVVCAVTALLISPAVVAWQPSAAPVRVTVDVKPGDTPTTLEPKRQGMVPIAILSTKDFDAAQIDIDTARAGATGVEATAFKHMLEDVDRDKDVDLLMLFRVADLGLTCQSKGVTVKAKTDKGQSIEGTETVTMVGC
jgi:hypothetical protein